MRILYVFLFLLIGSCNDQISLKSPVSSPEGPQYIDTTPPSVSIEVAKDESIGTCNFSSVNDPSYTDGFSYRVFFSEKINPTTFTTSDVLNTGNGGGVSLIWSITNCGDDTNFKLTAVTVIGPGTITPVLPADAVEDRFSNKSLASISTDNVVNFYQGWYQEAYIKAANAEEDDLFGTSISLFGNTLAVGAPNESSNGTTITSGIGASGDNSNLRSGAVFVYKRVENVWAQEAFIKASNNNSQDQFGTSVSLSQNLLVVGAPGEDSNQTSSTAGASSNNTSLDSGAAYIFTKNGGLWAFTRFLKPSNNTSSDAFGSWVSASENFVAIGSRFEDSSDTTITNGSSSSIDDSKTNSGAIYIYQNIFQVAYIKASNSDASDEFGKMFSINKDTLAVGVPAESSSETTITNGTTSSLDNSSSSSGAVYVYRRSSNLWAQEAYIKAPNAEANDEFGTSVSLSGDTLAVGASKEDSNLSTITSGPFGSADNSYTDSGAVYIFR